MAKPGPETRLVAKMKAAMKAEYGDRIVIVKYHGSQFTEAGVSDLLICFDGHFLAVEVKAPENYGGSVERAAQQGTTVKQEAFLARVLKAGGFAMVAASVEGLMQTLDEIEKDLLRFPET